MDLNIIIAVLQLSNKKELSIEVNAIKEILEDAGISVYTDASGAAIGRLYSRLDEIGVYKTITVDFDTPKDLMVTIRHRETTNQVRVPIVHIKNFI